MKKIAVHNDVMFIERWSWSFKNFLHGWFIYQSDMLYYTSIHVFQMMQYWNLLSNPYHGSKFQNDWLTKNGFIDARPFLIVHVEKENICDFKAFNILLLL